MTVRNTLTCVVLALCCFQLTAVAQQDSIDFFSLVNSQVDEQHPIVSPDGQVLFFTRAHHPGNVGGERDQGDIWYSTLQQDLRWSAPRNLRSLNNSKWNGVIGFSEDGGTIYLMGHYKLTNGAVRSQGIAKAKRKGNGSWSDPEDIEIPYFKNLSRNHGAYISPDEKVLIMALESYGTRGAEDLYVSIKGDNNKWSDPKNLGANINTKFQEMTPYLSDDKRTLYFSTNGRGGSGSSDVLTAERQGDDWINWSTPKHLNTVNTGGRELGYKSYGDYSLYTSTLSSDGYGDIKIFSPHDLDSIITFDETSTNDSSHRLEELPVEVAKSNPNDITLYGKVYDAESNSTLKAEVHVSLKSGKPGKKAETADGNRYYSVNIKSAGEYVIRVDAPGYVSHQETLDIFSMEIKLLEMNFNLQPIRVGTKVNLEHVLFKQSSPQILTSSYPELQLVVDLMKKNTSMKIRLEGHTDNRGGKKSNLKLSKSRAKAVQEYLTSKGIPSRRISWKGYGGSQPIADNENPETRKMNRRVEFTIIKE